MVESAGVELQQYDEAGYRKDGKDGKNLSEKCAFCGAPVSIHTTWLDGTPVDLCEAELCQTKHQERLSTQAARQQVDDLTHLARFLAIAWTEADNWIMTYGVTLEEILKYPIIQGSRNQMNIREIGEQPFEAVKVGRAIKRMIPAPEKKG